MGAAFVSRCRPDWSQFKLHLSAQTPGKLNEDKDTEWTLMLARKDVARRTCIGLGDPSYKQDRRPCRGTSMFPLGTNALQAPEHKKAPLASLPLNPRRCYHARIQASTS